MKNLFYFLGQCSWGCIQNLLGLFLFLFNYDKPHFYYHVTIICEWSYLSGLSLGCFIFVPDHNDEDILNHEYGHTIQSLILGPFYLLVIGLPSLIWCNLPYFKRRRTIKHISYYSFYTEKWANRLVEKYLHKTVFL